MSVPFGPSQQSTRMCRRCEDLGIDCHSFEKGTKLIACEACSDSGRVCTNFKEGLRCDGCVERGQSCSRERRAPDEVGKGKETEKEKEMEIVVEKEVQAEAEGVEEDEKDRRSCKLCSRLRQFCDGSEPACGLCLETGLTCQYLATTDAHPSQKQHHLHERREEGQSTSDRSSLRSWRYRNKTTPTRNPELYPGSCVLCQIPIETSDFVCPKCSKENGTLDQDIIIQQVLKLSGRSDDKERRDELVMDDIIVPAPELKVDRKGKGRVEVIGKEKMKDSRKSEEARREREEEHMEMNDWETISRDEAFGVMRDGELGVMELD